MNFMFFQDFDISACYKETEKIRLAVRFPLSNEIDLEVRTDKILFKKMIIFPKRL